MRITKCTKVHSTLMDISPTNQDLIALTSTNKKIQIISAKECKNRQNIYLDLLGEKTTAIAFHPQLSLLAIANGNSLFILNIAHRNIIQTFQSYDGIIDSLYFLQNTPYIISGTRNGRVVQYRYEGKLHISRLCSFKKELHGYVSAFTDNQRYLACSGSGGDVILIEYNSHARKVILKNSNKKVTAITFLSQNRIIYANEDGTLFLANIEYNGVFKEIETNQRDICNIFLLKESSLALIVSKSENIILFDTQNFTIVKSTFLHCKEKIQKALLLEEDTLLLYLDDNTLVKVSLDMREELQKALQESALLRAFELLEENPLLQRTPQAQEAEILYNKLYKKIFLKILATKELHHLKEIEAFESFKNKKGNVRALELALQNYEKLKNFTKEYKYTLAYALCEKYPPLKMTTQYRVMEEFYKKSFTQAQKQLLRNNTQEAKALLEPFATIQSKHSMVQLLRRQNQEFVAFLKAISKKEYAKVSALAQISPVFKQVPSYIALQNEAYRHLQDIKQLIDIGEVTKAQQKIKKLQNISFIKEDLQQLSHMAKDAAKLLQSYENEAFAECYCILDKNIELASMQLAQLLEKHWRKIIQECEIYALEGNIKEIKAKLGELITIESRKNKIGDLLRLSFLVKIDTELEAKKYKTAEHFIYFYIDIFGIDSELKQLMKNFEKVSKQKLALTPPTQKYKERDAWLKSDMFIHTHHS